MDFKLIMGWKRIGGYRPGKDKTVIIRISGDAELGDEIYTLLKNFKPKEERTDSEWVVR